MIYIQHIQIKTHGHSLCVFVFLYNVGLMKAYLRERRRQPRVSSVTSVTALTSTTQRTAPLRLRAPTLYLTPPTMATLPLKGPTVISARPSDMPQSPAMMIRPSRGSRCFILLPLPFASSP